MMLFSAIVNIKYIHLKMKYILKYKPYRQLNMSRINIGCLILVNSMKLYEMYTS